MPASAADALCAELERTVGPPNGRADGAAATWVRSPCLGMCERAPAVLVQRAGRGTQDVAFGHASAAQVRSLLADAAPGPSSRDRPTRRSSSAPQTWDRDRATACGCCGASGVADPTSIDDYRAHGGYEALRRAHELGPEGVIREVTDAKLLGRGGAAFPTGVKWKAVAEQPVRPHYFICNADESEPGTFKDRVVMEQDPFAVIEALTIAGYATGCERGYIYIRGEYPLATARLGHAIAEARRHGFLGDDVMGEGFAFDIELRRGAGAYICGEETALFNSIEGKRGEPRNKPPFPVQRGVFGKPTGINNVETLINVLEILRDRRVSRTRRSAPKGSTGPRLFCVSGTVARPGLYEVESGATLREVLDLAGGDPGRRRRRSCSAARPAGSSHRTISTSSSRSRTRARAGTRWAPAS